MKGYLFVCVLMLPLIYSHAQSNLDINAGKRLTLLEEEVWTSELAYWNAVKKGDKEAYIDLYHADHVSWPSFVSSPQTAKQIESTLPEFIAMVKPGSTKFKLTKLSVDIRNNLAFVYYLSDWSMKTINDEDKKFSEKFFHVWQRKGGRWFLIGGMSAMLER